MRMTCSASASRRCGRSRAIRARPIARSTGRPMCSRRASCFPRRSARPTCARRASTSAGAMRATGCGAVALPNQNAWSRRLSVSCRHDTDADLLARFARQPARLLLTQGFIARHADGGTAMLGRGGSDTSAAYFGALLRRAPRRDLDRRARHVQRQSARSARCAPAGAAGLRRSAGNRDHRREGAASALDRSLPRCRACRWRSSTPNARTCPARASTRRVATVPGVKAISRATASCWCRWKASACGSRSASSPTCSSASSGTACRST